MKKSITGKLKLEITCADAGFLLNILSSSGIFMEEIYHKDAMTISMTVKFADYSAVESICNKQGASLKILSHSGLLRWIMVMLKRPVLTVFFCLLGIAYCVLPSRILFVSVEGNVNIPTNQILESAEACGITIGASRRQVRSEKMKNSLLQKIPELQWAGINTSGCTAIISVREKTTVPAETEKDKFQVSSIVAARDGVIQNTVVYQGNALCTVGQAVKKGQVLVSGYTDCGIVTKTTQAAAEIEALTFRDIEIISTGATYTRQGQYSKNSRYALKIGKKLINLFKYSGNSDTSCAKIYEERYVQLPGGFQLPVAIVKETCYFYESQGDPSNLDTGEWLSDYAEDYLQQTMVSGRIISKETQLHDFEDGKILYGKYACIEMIGQIRFEQTMIDD